MVWMGPARGLILHRSALLDDGSADVARADDLVAEHHQATDDVAEVVRVVDHLALDDLGREGQAGRVAEHAVRGRAGGGLAQQVAALIDREPIDLAHLAVAQDRHAIASQRRDAQVRLLDQRDEPRRRHEPTALVGHVLLVESPRLMSFESAPAVGPWLSADTSAGMVSSMSASAAMRSWIEPSLAKMSARFRSDWRESTVDNATAKLLAWSIANVTELLVGYWADRPAPIT